MRSTPTLAFLITLALPLGALADDDLLFDGSRLGRVDVRTLDRADCQRASTPEDELRVDELVAGLPFDAAPLAELATHGAAACAGIAAWLAEEPRGPAVLDAVQFVVERGDAEQVEVALAAARVRAADEDAGVALLAALTERHTVAGQHTADMLARTRSEAMRAAAVPLIVGSGPRALPGGAEEATSELEVPEPTLRGTNALKALIGSTEDPAVLEAVVDELAPLVGADRRYADYGVVLAAALRRGIELLPGGAAVATQAALAMEGLDIPGTREACTAMYGQDDPALAEAHRALVKGTIRVVRARQLAGLSLDWLAALAQGPDEAANRKALRAAKRLSRRDERRARAMGPEPNPVKLPSEFGAR